MGGVPNSMGWAGPCGLCKRCVRSPHLATKRARGVSKCVALTHAGCAAGAFGGAPYGAANSAMYVMQWVVMAHAGCAARVFGGAPIWGHITWEGCADMGGADARGPRRGCLRWSSLRGHEVCVRCVSIVGAGACGGMRGRAAASFGGAPYGAVAPLRGAPKYVAQAHADCATEVFGGVPCGAKKRVKGLHH